MNFDHESLHQKALFTAKEYLRNERDLIGILQEVDLHKTYLHYEMTTLFNYAVTLLNLSRDTAYALINIARKSVEVPELKAAIEEKKITVSNARKITSILNTENKMEWLSKAASLPQRKLEFELAKSFPEKAEPTKIKVKSETLGRLEVDLANTVLDQLKRVQEILSQKKQKHIDVANALEEIINEFIVRHDPLEKAKRAVEKQNPSKTVRKVGVRPNIAAAHQQKKDPSHEDVLREIAKQQDFPVPRKSLQAHQGHAVRLKDQGRCSHVYPDGTRCEATRWLHVHHKNEVSKGGSNNPSNLQLLCSAHHRLLHRTGLAKTAMAAPRVAENPVEFYRRN